MYIYIYIYLTQTEQDFTPYQVQKHPWTPPVHKTPADSLCKTYEAWTLLLKAAERVGTLTEPMRLVVRQRRMPVHTVHNTVCVRAHVKTQASCLEYV